MPPIAAAALAFYNLATPHVKHDIVVFCILNLDVKNNKFSFNIIKQIFHLCNTVKVSLSLSGKNFKKEKLAFVFITLTFK